MPMLTPVRIGTKDNHCRYLVSPARPHPQLCKTRSCLLVTWSYSGGISVSVPVRFRHALGGLLGVILIAICQNAHASVGLGFRGLVRTLNTGSITLSSPAGTVVDLAGDLFVADTGDN